MSPRRRISLIATLALLPFSACATAEYDADGDALSEGEAFDEDNPGADLELGKADAPGYRIPTGLPALERPEIVVSLDGLTVHLFDRATGVQRVYPVGVGVMDDDGVSVTPTGSFATSPDLTDTWWYVKRRRVPEYFGGLPFLRIDARNSDGANTYGLHGPITEELIRGYVSHGCMRMEADDIIELFWLVNRHPATPVTIQTEVELDAVGAEVDVGTVPALEDPGQSSGQGWPSWPSFPTF